MSFEEKNCMKEETIKGQKFLHFIVSDESVLCLDETIYNTEDVFAIKACFHSTLKDTRLIGLTKPETKRTL